MCYSFDNIGKKPNVATVFFYEKFSLEHDSKVLANIFYDKDVIICYCYLYISIEFYSRKRKHAVFSRSVLNLNLLLFNKNLFMKRGKDSHLSCV